MKQKAMSDNQILQLFPIPVQMYSIQREFSKKEMDFFTKQKKKTFKSVGNLITQHQEVLEEPILKKLKKDLLTLVNDFYYHTMSYTGSTPYITQSWLNYTKKGEHHHRHKHPNSLISGVLYIEADEQNDNITFWNSRYKEVQPEIKEYNILNSDSWWIPVKPKRVVLFPSSLEHSVQIKEGTNERISLAFNVFVKGKIGRVEDSTWLNIK